MFSKLKTFVSGVGLVFKYGDLASGIVKAWNSFPGLDADVPVLRRWLKSLLLDASVLALLTKTEFDDNIVIGVRRLVDDDRAWAIIHSLALLARDGGIDKDGTLIPEWVKQNVPENAKSQSNILASVYESAASGIERGTIRTPEAVVHGSLGFVRAS